MTNKFNSFYLTLLVVLTGALIVAPAMTALGASTASATDESSGYSLYTGGQFLVQEVQFDNTNASSGGPLELDYLEVQFNSGSSNADFTRLSLWRDGGDGSFDGAAAGSDDTQIGSYEPNPDLSAGEIIGKDDDAAALSVAKGDTATVFVALTVADSLDSGSDFTTQISSVDYVTGSETGLSTPVSDDTSNSVTAYSSGTDLSTASDEVIGFTDYDGVVLQPRIALDGSTYVYLYDAGGSNWNLDPNTAETVDATVKAYRGAGTITSPVATATVTLTETSADSNAFRSERVNFDDLFGSDVAPGYRVTVDVADATTVAYDRTVDGVARQNKKNAPQVQPNLVPQIEFIGSAPYQLENTLTLEVQDDKLNAYPTTAETVDQSGTPNLLNVDSSVNPVFQETGANTGVFTYEATPKQLGKWVGETMNFNYEYADNADRGDLTAQKSVASDTPSSVTVPTDFTQADNFKIVVTDRDESSSASAGDAESVTVSVENLNSGETETVTLNEDNDVAGKFVGTLTLGAGGMQVDVDDELKASYTDPDTSSDTSSATGFVGETTVVLYDSASAISTTAPAAAKGTYNSIEGAVGGADDNSSDVVVVQAGYDSSAEDFPITVDKEGVTIQAATDASPVVDAWGSGAKAFEVTQGDNNAVTIKGLEIISADNKQAIKVHNTPSDIHLKVEDSVFKLNDSTINGTNTNAGILAHTASSTYLDVSGSTFMGGSHTAGKIAGIWGTFSNNSTKSTIKENEFTDLTFAVQVNDPLNVVVKNNYFHDLKEKEAIWVDAANVTVSQGQFIIDGNTFKEVAAGIMFADNGSGHVFDIRFNNFINAGKGSTVGSAYSASSSYAIDGDANGDYTYNVDQNYWGQASGAESTQYNNTGTPTNDLTASVFAGEFDTGVTSLNDDDSALTPTEADPVPVIFSNDESEDEDYGAALYDAVPKATKAAADEYYELYLTDTNSNDTTTTLKFYTGTDAENTAYVWDATKTEWVKIDTDSNMDNFSSFSAQNYNAEDDYVQLDITVSSGATDRYKIAIAQAPVQLSYVPTSKGWQMFSVDAMPANRVPSELFGSQANAVLTYDPVNGEYLVGDDMPEVGPTYGYWLFAGSGVVDNETNIVSATSATPVNEDEVLTLEDAGYQMISAPFNTYWGDVMVEYDGTEQSVEEAAIDEWMSGKIWTWDMANETYVSSVAPDGMIEADKAYWVKTNNDDIALEFPYSPEPSPASASMSLSEMGFSPVAEGESAPPAPPAAPQAAEGLEATAAVSAEGVTFEVAGADVDGISVQVFSANGEEVFSGSAEGSTLSWNAEVANGLYLFGATAEVDGQTTPLGVQKLLILQ